ncbi:MAG: hypothetical protein QF819_01325 [Gemmatimonadota bacterium]|jgi:hypothetical protein|nr:hypothetical protein [Gemmatimonadota bacterium]MDP6801809.1 hypothetical protein [Gemmatimonadota bacterium]MDP7032552.1 hypothetical protein [Gemmatimonadota bacterium]
MRRTSKGLLALLALVVTGAMAGCLGTSDDSGDYGNLLTQPALFDNDEILGASGIGVGPVTPGQQVSPVPRYRGHSVPLGPPSGGFRGDEDYEYDPTNPPRELDFHVASGASKSYRWRGSHKRTGAKKSTYMDTEIGTKSRHEHITSSEAGHYSLFKPYNTSHIVEGNFASLYE